MQNVYELTDAQIFLQNNALLSSDGASIVLLKKLANLFGRGAIEFEAENSTSGVGVHVAFSRRHHFFQYTRFGNRG